MANALISRQDSLVPLAPVAVPLTGTPIKEGTASPVMHRTSNGTAPRDRQQEAEIAASAETDVAPTSAECPFTFSTRHSASPSIEVIIREIVHEKLRQPSLDLEPWIRVCRQNLITNGSALATLQPSRLRKLQLPLLLEQELEEYYIGPRGTRRHRKSDQGWKNQPSKPALSKMSRSPSGASHGAFGLDDKMRRLVKSSWMALESSNDTSIGSPLHQFFVCVVL